VGQRGPKPSENSVTRHAPKQRKRSMEAATPGVPELATSFPSIAFLPQTLAWWEAWKSSPQSSFFAATDWQTLLRLAPMVDLYFTSPTAQLASEIRQTEAKLGATASDRDRLGWKIEPPAPEGAAGEKPKGSRSRPDPRKGASA
jgi:hypothetical protein